MLEVSSATISWPGGLRRCACRSVRLCSSVSKLPLHLYATGVLTVAGSGTGQRVICGLQHQLPVGGLVQVGMQLAARGGEVSSMAVTNLIYGVGMVCSDWPCSPQGTAARDCCLGAEYLTSGRLVLFLPAIHFVDSASGAGLPTRSLWE